MLVKGAPDSKVRGANVGPTWGRQDPGGPHVGHMNFAIWDTVECSFQYSPHCFGVSFVNIVFCIMVL